MKISSYDVNLNSAEAFQRTATLNENLNIWVDGQKQNQQAEETKIPPAVLIDLSDAGKSLASSNVKPKDEVKISLSEKDKRLIALLEAFFEKLTGKKYKFIIPKEEGDTSSSDQGASLNANGSTPAVNGAANGNNGRVGWGLVYERHESIQESQSFQFKGTGTVRTEDGKTIDFSIALNMSRSFVQESNLSIKAGDALKDPLVINYAAPTAALANTKISIDIDNDGDVDQISNLAQGSGFLALDKNGDGTINDGSELFGPTSGNGFNDLAAYDSDKNNWIDENDPIFNKLRIWSVDQSGASSLIALGQQGVGAIYLGNVSTQFDFKSGDTTEGKIQRTGIFLNENGSAGTIQHVDLKV